MWWQYVGDRIMYFVRILKFINNNFFLQLNMYIVIRKLNGFGVFFFEYRRHNSYHDIHINADNKRSLLWKLGWMSTSIRESIGLQFGSFDAVGNRLEEIIMRLVQPNLHTYVLVHLTTTLLSDRAINSTRCGVMVRWAMSAGRFLRYFFLLIGASNCTGARFSSPSIVFD